jgi:hypothetical protein
MLVCTEGGGDKVVHKQLGNNRELKRESTHEKVINRVLKHRNRY